MKVKFILESDIILNISEAFALIIRLLMHLVTYASRSSSLVHKIVSTTTKNPMKPVYWICLSVMTNHHDTTDILAAPLHFSSSTRISSESEHC